jgi:hypothetical protein
VIPPCLICGKELACVFPDAPFDVYNQPYKATAFTSHGHYGSTVFDPVTSSRYLEVNLCDECLIERRDRVLHVTPGPQVIKFEPRAWDPEND